MMKAGDCTVHDTGVPLDSIHGSLSSLDRRRLHALCSKYAIVETIW